MRTVASYRRALETMGKLSAQQAGASSPAPGRPESPYVRVVDADTTPPATPRPPSVRTRPRPTRRNQPPAALATPGPNTRVVPADEAAAAPAAAPSWERPQPRFDAGRMEPGPDGAAALVEPYAMGPEPTDGWEHAAGPVEWTVHEGGIGTTASPGPPPEAMLHFDATDDPAGFDGSPSWADVAPSQPDWEARSRTRSAPLRSERPTPTFRKSRPARRRWAAGAVAAAVLIVAAIVGVTLAGRTGSQRHPPAVSPQTTVPRPAAPVASPRTTPTTAPSTAILVATSIGSSTYRVDASATITFRAGTGACWVEIRQSGPYGPVMFTGDLLAGQSRALNGPVWVRLGNPRVIAVTVNGTSISPPGMTSGAPYDLQFA